MSQADVFMDIGLIIYEEHKTRAIYDCFAFKNTVYQYIQGLF